MMSTIYDHAGRYETKCRPLIEKIGRIFDAHHLPWYANFAVANSETGTRYVVAGQPGGENGNAAPQVTMQFRISAGETAAPVRQAITIGPEDVDDAQMPYSHTPATQSRRSGKPESGRLSLSKTASEIKKACKPLLDELEYSCMVCQIPFYFSGCVDLEPPAYITRGVPPYTVDVELHENQIRDNLLIGRGFEAVKSNELVTETPDDL